MNEAQKLRDAIGIALRGHGYSRILEGIEKALSDFDSQPQPNMAERIEAAARECHKTSWGGWSVQDSEDDIMEAFREILTRHFGATEPECKTCGGSGLVHGKKVWVFTCPDCEGK